MKIATSNVMISVIVACWSLGKPPSYLFIFLHFPGPNQILLTQTNGSKRALHHYALYTYTYIHIVLYIPLLIIYFNETTLGFFLAMKNYICSTQYDPTFALKRALVFSGLTFKHRGHLGISEAHQSCFSTAFRWSIPQ